MQFRGVYPDAESGKFKSYIQHEGKRIFVGSFDTDTEAAQAYDAKAAELFGDKAKPNLPTQDGQLMTIDLENLKIDPSLQRATLSQETIDNYADPDVIDKLPPGDAFFFDNAFWLTAGRHRYEGRKKAGKRDMQIVVHLGDRQEAVRFSAGSNDDHGLPRTLDDKIKAIQMLLDDPKWGSRSTRWIAETAKVSQQLVEKHRLLHEQKTAAQHEAEEAEAEAEAGKDGEQNGEPKKKPKPKTRTDKRGNQQPAKKEKAKKPGQPVFDDKLIEKPMGELARAVSDRGKAVGKGPLYAACHEALDAVAVAWKAWKKG